MEQYTITEWFLFFFIYCFLGWIWESVYVSVREGIKKRQFEWINRGFLKGPAIPIYGCAAVSVLIATLPVKENVALVFFFGAFAATVLELVTGTAMERLFHVKYWDYSYMPLNYHGRICLFVSLFWGVLSLVLVEFIHRPISQAVLMLPYPVMEILAFAILAVFTYDFSGSLKEALDMKELLEKLTENRIVIERLEQRVDAVIAFTNVPKIEDLKGIPSNAKDRFMKRLEKFRENRLNQMLELKTYILEKEGTPLLDREEMILQLEKQIRSVLERTNKQYLRVANHLRRNPGAISKKYKEAFEELKSLLEDKHKS